MPGHSIAEVQAILDDTIDRFDLAATDPEVALAQRAWSNVALFRLESSLSWAGLLGGRLRSGPIPSPFDGDLARYAAIRPDAVRGAVRAFLGRAHRVTVHTHATTNRPPAGVLRAESAGAP